MTRPRLFLSAVSTELRAARQRVARTVRTLGYDPVSQDDFPTGHGELRKWLREQIDACEGLVQLVGQGYGAEPATMDPEYGRVSYTQFELLYAVRQGKKTWVIVVGQQCQRDKPVDQLDLPDDPLHPDPAGYQAERQALQRDYIARLVRENYLRHTANNDTELENVVLRLRDELGELRRDQERQEKRRSRAMLAVLLVLILLGGGGAARARTRPASGRAAARGGWPSSPAPIGDAASPAELDRLIAALSLVTGVEAMVVLRDWPARRRRGVGRHRLGGAGAARRHLREAARGDRR